MSIQLLFWGQVKKKPAKDQQASFSKVLVNKKLLHDTCDVLGPIVMVIWIVQKTLNAHWKFILCTSVYL